MDLTASNLTKKQRRKLRQNGVLDRENNLNKGNFKLKQVDPLTETQSDVFEAYNEGYNLFLHGSAGTGKAQPINSKVLTPFGWSQIGDLSIGDNVVSATGNISKVIGVFPQGEKQNYTVTFCDGGQTQCCGEHLWTGWVKTPQQDEPKLQTKTLYEIIDIQQKGGSFSIPLLQPIQTPDIDLSVCPYMLGQRLISDYNDNNIQSQTERIIYTGSLNQRVQLLRGLFDVNGQISSETDQITFNCLCRQLAYCIQYLIRSVGGKASVIDPEDVLDYRYKVLANINVEQVLSTVQDKQFSINNNKQITRELVSIQCCGTAQMQCIAIDDPSHLYVTDDFIVTHNTFLALYLGLNDVFDYNTDYKKVVIVRSAVPTREIGHLPGTKKEKEEVYEAPYIDACAKLFGRGDAYSILKQKKSIEFISTSFVRGTTLSDCIVIFDEIQNCTFQELDTLITRSGKNCKLIYCGDTKQDDLTNDRKKEKSGIKIFTNIIENIEEFDLIEFTSDDIVRSGLVKSYIIEKEKQGL